MNEATNLLTSQVNNKAIMITRIDLFSANRKPQIVYY